MKQILILAAAVLMAGQAFAQNEELNVYRSDKQFNNYRISEIQELNYEKDSRGLYTKMTVKTEAGETSANLTAIDSCTIRQTTLPDIYINLIDYPDIDDLFKGNGFKKSTIYRATMRLDGRGTHEDIEEQEVEFRGRGNTTWTYAKTPYRFKMAKKASVCGLPKAKSFALIANYIDQTHLRNTVAFWVAQQLGLPYTNHSVHCNLYLNGKYRGLYMITEKIGIGGGSVDIDENTSMMFELDKNYDEDFQFKHPVTSKLSLPVMVKDPDLTEIKPDEAEREAYWKEWQADFAKMADAVMVGSAEIGNYLDLQEAARYILVYSVACNRELNHPKSANMFKEGLGADFKYRLGPVWDFDWSTGYRAAGPPINSYNRVLISEANTYPGSAFFMALLKNKAFMDVYREVWKEFYTEIYPQMMGYIDEQAREIEPSAKRDGVRWPDAQAYTDAYAVSSFDTAKHIGELKTWLTNRIKWLNGHATLGLY